MGSAVADLGRAGVSWDEDAEDDGAWGGDDWGEEPPTTTVPLKKEKPAKRKPASPKKASKKPVDPLAAFESSLAADGGGVSRIICFAYFAATECSSRATAAWHRSVDGSLGWGPGTASLCAVTS